MRERAVEGPLRIVRMGSTLGSRRFCGVPRAVPNAAVKCREMLTAAAFALCAQRVQKALARSGEQVRGLQRASGLRAKDVVGEDASQVLVKPCSEQRRQRKLSAAARVRAFAPLADFVAVAVDLDTTPNNAVNPAAAGK